MADAAVPVRRCRAHSKQRKAQCKLFAVPGALVCRMHGGLAPQVQRRAKQRLLEAADGAAARLAQLVDSDDEAIAVRAATALLDRSGHGPSSTQVQVDGGEVQYKIEGVDMGAL